MPEEITVWFQVRKKSRCYHGSKCEKRPVLKHCFWRHGRCVELSDSTECYHGSSTVNSALHHGFLWSQNV